MGRVPRRPHHRRRLPSLPRRRLPLVNRGGFKTYLFLLVLLGIPVTVGYWTLISIYGRRKNEKVELPGKPIESYLSIKDLELRTHYHGQNKIPMQVFHDAYFDSKIDINGSLVTSIRSPTLLIRLFRRRVGGPGKAT
jgi:hypothetical protein